MGKIVGKIVLTGGPCAGKTSALTKIEEELTEKGYKVFIVSESATELIKGGIKPFGSMPIELVKFQSLILKYQYEKEKIYEEAAKSLSDDEKCIIIYDRGLLDNKAYINQQIFNELLKKQGLKELEIMDNYNMVIHLVTAADGAEEAYTLGNNVARTETIDEAKELDNRTVNAWAGHPNLRIIANEKDFASKLQNVVDEINNLIGEPVSIRKQRKFLIDLENSDLSFLTEDNSTAIHIEQTYINDNPDVETRLRKRTYNGQSCFYLTVQVKEKDGKSTVLTNRKITEKEYTKQLSTAVSTTSVSKNRYSFSKNKQYFRLDVFEELKNYALLEIDPTYENSSIKLPKEIRVIEDVTNSPYYDNHVISEMVTCEKNKVLIK